MWNLLRKRLLQLILVVWGVGSLTFVLMRSLPGDIAYRIAASRYGQDNVDSNAAQLVHQELNLDQSWFVSYIDWLFDLLQFNLGNSLVSGLPVINDVTHQLGYSLLLALSAMSISIIIGLILGIWSATKGGMVNTSLVALSTMIKSLPVFVIGLVFILLFAMNWQFLPVAGFGSWQHLILPSITLAISLAAVSNRVVYINAKAVLRSAFYRFSRVKGLTKFQTFMRHGVRNISVPIVAFFGIQLIGVIEGVVMIESLFSWPGVGHGLAHAIFARDIPVIQGCALVMGMLFVVLNTIIDILCYWLDPRGQQEI